MAITDHPRPQITPTDIPQEEIAERDPQIEPTPPRRSKAKIAGAIVGGIAALSGAVGIGMQLGGEEEPTAAPAPATAPADTAPETFAPSSQPAQTTPETAPSVASLEGPFTETADGYPVLYSLESPQPGFQLEPFETGDQDLIGFANGVRGQTEIVLHNNGLENERDFGTVVGIPLTYKNPETHDTYGARLFVFNPIRVDDAANDRTTYVFRMGRETNSPSYAVAVENWGQGGARSSVDGITIDHDDQYLGPNRQITQFERVTEEERLIPAEEDNWPSAQISLVFGSGQNTYAGAVVVNDDGAFSVGFTRPEFEESRLAFNAELLETAMTPLAGSVRVN